MPLEPDNPSGTLPAAPDLISAKALTHAVSVDAQAVADYICDLEENTASLVSELRKIAIDKYRVAQITLSALTGNKAEAETFSDQDLDFMLERAHGQAPRHLLRPVVFIYLAEEPAHQGIPFGRKLSPEGAGFEPNRGNRRPSPTHADECFRLRLSSNVLEVQPARQQLSLEEPEFHPKSESPLTPAAVQQKPLRLSPGAFEIELTRPLSPEAVQFIPPLRQLSPDPHDFHSASRPLSPAASEFKPLPRPLSPEASAFEQARRDDVSQSDSTCERLERDTSASLTTPKGQLPGRSCLFYVSGEQCPFQNRKGGCFGVHDIAEREVNLAKRTPALASMNTKPNLDGPVLQPVIQNTSQVSQRQSPTSSTVFGPTKRSQNRQCKFYVNGERCPYQNRKGGCHDIHDLTARRSNLLKLVPKIDENATPGETAVNPNNKENAPVDLVHQSKAVELKLETPRSRPALQVHSQNIVSLKGTVHVAPSINVSILKSPKSNAVLPDPFFAFLNKKMETDKKAAQDRISPKVVEWNTNTTASGQGSAKLNLFLEKITGVQAVGLNPGDAGVPSSFESNFPAQQHGGIQAVGFNVAGTGGTQLSSQSSLPLEPNAKKPNGSESQTKKAIAEQDDVNKSTAEERKGAVQVRKLSIARLIKIDDTNYLKELIATLDGIFKGVCPASLNIGLCALDQSLSGGCTMRKSPCSCTGCPHDKRTCYREAKGKICMVVKRDPEFYAKHMAEVVHKDQCDPDEWKQRVTVANLVKAHYDGRYR